MPDTTLIPSPAVASHLEDLIPRPMIFPGEDPALYEGLREAFLQDLAPRSPYEHALAENLIRLEWEALRHSRMRDDLIRAQTREFAVGVYATGAVQEVDEYSEEDVNSAFDLVTSDPERSAAAVAALQASEITPGEIVAKAYSRVAAQVERHEKQIAQIETRRRRLREDYDRLRAARPKPVEDAEIVG